MTPSRALRVVVCVLGVSAGPACGGPSTASSSSTEPATWLEGAWTAQDVTELWAREGGVLYGASVGAAGIELLRFDGAHLWAAPPGRAPVRFDVRRPVDGEAGAFEVFRDGHDPEWIRYTRDGANLVAEIGVGERVHGRWDFVPDARGHDLRFFGPVDATVERRGGEVWMVVPPCVCAPTIRCAGEYEGDRLVLLAAVFDTACEACERGEVRCDTPPRPNGPHEVTLGGQPLSPQTDGSFRGTGRMFATLR